MPSPTIATMHRLLSLRPPVQRCHPRKDLFMPTCCSHWIFMACTIGVNHTMESEKQLRTYLLVWENTCDDICLWDAHLPRDSFSGDGIVARYHPSTDTLVLQERHDSIGFLAQGVRHSICCAEHKGLALCTCLRGVAEFPQRKQNDTVPLGLPGIQARAHLAVYGNTMFRHPRFVSDDGLAPEGVEACPDSAARDLVEACTALRARFVRAVALNGTREGVRARGLEFSRDPVHDVGCPAGRRQPRVNNARIAAFRERAGFVENDEIELGRFLEGLAASANEDAVLGGEP